MQEAATDASHYGPFFRLLRTKDVFAFLPYHPEFEEDEEVPMDRPFPMVVFGGCEEAFYPVFTSRAVAEWSLPKFSKPDARLMVVSLPAVAWFHSAAQHGRRVVINPASTLRMEMEHNAVVAWVKDQMDTPLGNHEGAERTFVRSVNFELSPEYREKVNKFCRNRRSYCPRFGLGPGE